MSLSKWPRFIYITRLQKTSTCTSTTSKKKKKGLCTDVADNFALENVSLVTKGSLNFGKI